MLSSASGSLLAHLGAYQAQRYCRLDNKRLSLEHDSRLGHYFLVKRKDEVRPSTCVAARYADAAGRV